ncbi:glycosyltransferase family 4 protein [Plantactinospora sp. GCM10030261]|uniref:glycosyltransferase family 4 protein n=1 Tax=Plantactinospora sp. GCM10030261 TaxID=3273420 RepID=UPI00361E4535
MVVPPWYELPPPGYGGLEQVCAALVDALVDRGHDVTLFGAGSGSGTRASFVGSAPAPAADRVGQVLPELAHLARVNQMLADERFDVVHDHTTAGVLFARHRPAPTVLTVHNRPTGELADVLTDVDPSAGLVAISHAQRRLRPELSWIDVVHNGMVGNLPVKARPGIGPVLWLARYAPDKGPDLAIHACRAAGLPLVLAGKCNEPVEEEYLHRVIEPMVGPDVTLLRNPDRQTCVDLLLAARCLIMPVRWEEPFGMAMLEAMATGTPVVALNRGAVPELINHGETGLICDDPVDLAPALRDVSAIEPENCVSHVRRWFSAERMAEGYERVYRAWSSDRRPELALSRSAWVP